MDLAVRGCQAPPKNSDRDRFFGSARRRPTRHGAVACLSPHPSKGFGGAGVAIAGTGLPGAIAAGIVAAHVGTLFDAADMKAVLVSAHGGDKLSSLTRFVCSRSVDLAGRACAFVKWVRAALIPCCQRWCFRSGPVFQFSSC